MIYQSPLTKLLSRGGGPADKPLNSIVGLTIKDAKEYPSAVVVVSGGYDGFTFSKTVYRQRCLTTTKTVLFRHRYSNTTLRQFSTQNTISGTEATYLVQHKPQF